MPTFFCPVCWAASRNDEPVCRHCGAEIGRIQAGKSYGQRLAEALRHPEPTTPLRVAMVLGLRREAGAVEALAACAHETGDLYLCLECLTALARIGTPEAWAAVASFVGDPRRVVAARARTLVGRRGAEAR
jgi:hypothetical protein